VFYGEEVGDCEGEDLIAFEGIISLTSLEVLNPCKDKGGELCDSEVVCSGKMELMEVSFPGSGEQITAGVCYFCSLLF
jgi:hypothetical protein